MDQNIFLGYLQHDFINICILLSQSDSNPSQI